MLLVFYMYTALSILLSEMSAFHSDADDDHLLCAFI